MTTKIEDVALRDLSQVNLEPRGQVFPSPSLWKDHIFYQILPDRFSDGREADRPLFDEHHPEQYRIQDKRAWMAAGLGFTGGTLQGIRSKLDYLQGLGITGLWITPTFKQRADLETYHGYALQNFLDIDPRFGTAQDMRDLIDDAHRVYGYGCGDYAIALNNQDQAITLSLPAPWQQGPLVLTTESTTVWQAKTAELSLAPFTGAICRRLI